VSPNDEGTLDLFEAEAEPASAPAPSDEPHVWSVSELNQALRSLLEEQLPELWVAGEVANWTRARSGHCYFTLKDENAQLRCVMWRRDAARLPVDPEEGMALRALGQVTLYEVRGDLQLQVRQLEADGGEGLWKLAFEKLRRRLEEEGLLDPARKRRLPRFPQAVGVVTSPTGAALQDILTVMGRRAPWTRVLLRGARVQGEGAAQEVADAIRTLGSAGLVDVLIVGRGGGSIEDLWAFNEEPVARAIAECPVPVISAVGHETDVTIADLVADLRAPTPSAAGEAAVQDGAALLEALDAVRPRLARGLQVQLERRKDRLGALSHRARAAILGSLAPRRAKLERRSDRLVPALRSLLVPRRNHLDGVARRLAPAFRREVERKGTRVQDRSERLERGMRTLIGDRREALARSAAQVDALSPLSTLRRGYSVALSAEGRVLRRTDEFGVGDLFDLRVVDGRIRSRVESIQPDDQDR
jgi:exodeoxyribonuclease VII large subunit